MQITGLALCALGFISLTAAQNGNDPLILNNRTGLAPVVYDGVTTLYTSTHQPAHRSVSIPVAPSSVRYYTSKKPTTPVQCWRNGYPCRHNGGHRSQRHVADFAPATVEIARRVPPPEFFSTRPDIPLPGQTDVPEETGDVPVNILPIPTSLLDGHQHNTLPPADVTDDVPVDILPIPTTFYNSKHSEAPAQPSETGDDRMDILPIPTSLLGGNQYDAPPQPSETEEPVFSILPISSISSEERTAIPTEWWRGPTGTGIPSEKECGPDGVRLPIQGSSSANAIDCGMHYCPSGLPTVLPLPESPTASISVIHSTSSYATSSHFTTPPEPTFPVESSRRKGPHIIEDPEEAGVPIDWWRGPGESVIPNEQGPVLRSSVTVAVPETLLTPPETLSSNTMASTDRCFRHYCPTGRPTVGEPMPTLTTLETVTKSQTQVPGTSFPAVPPSVVAV